MRVENFILISVVAFVTSEICGNPKFTGYIIGGKNITRSEIPWMVALKDTRTNLSSFFCGATLISRNHVLTGEKFFLVKCHKIISVKLLSRSLHSRKERMEGKETKRNSSHTQSLRLENWKWIRKQNSVAFWNSCSPRLGSAINQLRCWHCHPEVFSSSSDNAIHSANLFVESIDGSITNSRLRHWMGQKWRHVKETRNDPQTDFSSDPRERTLLASKSIFGSYFE